MSQTPMMPGRKNPREEQVSLSIKQLFPQVTALI